MSSERAADVDATPGVEAGRIGLQQSEKRVTARIIRTESGEVVPEYEIGGATVGTVEELKEVARIC